MRNVTLDENEVSMAAFVGAKRVVATKFSSTGVWAHGYNRNEWQDGAEGAAAEIAMAKAYGIYWNGSVNSFKKPDVGGIQVRHTVRPDGCLLVRSNDSDSELFYLVVGSTPNFSVIGFIRGKDAKKEEWLSDKGTGRVPCYFVPQSALIPSNFEG